MAMADDGETIVKERFFLDKANPNILHDEITTIDNALTRPWTVMKNYRRLPSVIWIEDNCAEGNNHIVMTLTRKAFYHDGFRPLLSGVGAFAPAQGVKLQQFRKVQAGDTK
jgi:hypothetical protein